MLKKPSGLISAAAGALGALLGDYLVRHSGLPAMGARIIATIIAILFLFGASAFFEKRQSK